MSHRAFVALGSNLQDPAYQVNQGFELLAQLPDTQLVRRSSLYRTTPVGYDNQPDFINAVAEVDTRLSALELLRALLAAETRQGRERPFPNAPRVLDLDLLLYDDLQLDTPELTLPHPRMQERGFVLLPLAEIAPELLLAGQGREPTRVIDLAQKLPPQGVEKLHEHY
jgi:2-amino-4-hydroxy-6-hydroxymethyldihydropteridine diphosphokinase